MADGTINRTTAATPRRFFAALALKNLLRYKRRTVVTASAIAIGLGVFIWVDSMLQSLAVESNLNLMHFETGSARITGESYWDERDDYPLDITVENTDEVLAQLDAAGIAGAPRIDFSGELLVHYDPFPEDGSVRMSFAAIDPERDPEVFRLFEHIVEGSRPEPHGDDILLSTWLAERLGAEVGYPVTVLTRTRDGFHQILDLEVAGFYETPNPQLDRSTAFMPLELAGEYLEMEGAVTGITLSLDETLPGTADLAPVRAAVDLQGLDLLGFDTLGAEVAGVVETQRKVSTAVLLLVALIALVGITNTMLMAVMERRREIGMMRAMGFRDREIRGVFAYEAAGIALLGAAGGLALGSLLVWHLETYGIDVRAVLQDADIGYRTLGIIRGVWRPAVMTAAAVAAVTVAALASRIPLRRMLAETIPDCLRGQKADSPEGRFAEVMSRSGTCASGLSAIALRNVFRHTRRTVLSSIAVAVAAMTLILLHGLFGGVAADLRENTFNYAEGEVRIRHESFDRYEYMNPIHYVVEDYRRVVERVQELDEVKAVSPRVTIPAGAIRAERQIGARGLGVDLELEREYQDLERIVAAGRMPNPHTTEALLGVRLAERLGVEVGDEVTFLTKTRTRRSNAFTVDVVGLARFPAAEIDRSTFIMPIESAGRFLRMDDAAVEVLLKSESGDSRALASAVNAMLAEHGPAGAHAASWKDVGFAYGLTSFVDVYLRLMSTIFLALAATVIINTTMMTVRERTTEIGTLAALGMRGREIVRLFLTEAFYIGLAGTILGVLLGTALTIVTGWTGLDFSARMDAADLNVSSIIYPVITLRTALAVAAFTVLVSSLASLFPASGAARLTPVEALRE